MVSARFARLWLGAALAAAPLLPAAARSAEEAPAATDEEGFAALFDGTSLAGWEGDEAWFRVEEGAIVAGSLKEAVPHNFFLCTEAPYGDFELRLKAKLVGEGDNAGIQFRSARIENHHEVSGYQCDVGMMGERPIWGSLYDESRRNKFLAHGDAETTAAALKAGDWNDLRIRCEGPRTRIWLNDVLTVDYVEADDAVARSGVIGLQIHGGPPAEAWYKDLSIRELGTDG